jgi:hypothetical protein
VVLQVWVPPEFDPASGTPAGNILKTRLQAFSRQNGALIEVRVKAVEGAGGLLDSLTTASAAAPTALPDLVALPRDQLEAAALKGLLHSYDQRTTVMEDPDWYGYAQELARLQNSVFGLPFAGDALVLTYRPAFIPIPPSDWQTTVQTPATLVFPAADPAALYTISMYQAVGGDVRDEQGRPFLDPIMLTEVLTYYAGAEQAGVLPFEITQLQNDDQVWEVFSEQRTNQVVTWASRFLSEPSDDAQIAPLPTQDGEPFSLANGWVWALAGNQAAKSSERERLSVALAEYLVDSTFLARWTRALGVLPPRTSALAMWPESPTQLVVDRISRSVILLPSKDIILSLGPPLEQATLQVLKQQSDPISAAQAAVQSLNLP